MKLLILCDEPGLRGAFGLRTELETQFCEHTQPIIWLRPTQPLSSAFAFTDSEEPVLVIDCLGCKGNPASSWLNDSAFAELIANCNEYGWIWLLLSDSRVFPTANKRRYSETDTAAPNMCAGEQLLARERYIADAVTKHIVLRTGPLIASRGDNLLLRLLWQLRAGGLVRTPEARRFCPTPAVDVARVIAAIHNQLDCGAASWGIYHYESADTATSDEFAEVVMAAATQYWPIAENPVSLQSVAGDIAEEIYPLLSCQRIRDTFGIQQLPWRKAIPSLLKQIYADNPS